MAHPGQKRAKILVIDDEPAVTAIIDEILQDAGYEVTCLNGSQFWMDVFNEFQPDLILLDIMMPGEDGYAVCSQLKADPSTASVPVIFLTGKGANDDGGRGFRSGAEMFIKKPFSCDRLLGIVDIVLSSSGRR